MAVARPRPETQALLLALLCTAVAVLCVWGILYLMGGRPVDRTDLAGRSRWLDEPLPFPSATPRKDPLEAPDGKASARGSLPTSEPTGRKEHAETHDLEVPRHALLVDERALRRSFDELEILDEVRAARVTALGAGCFDCEEGLAALDSGGAALRDSLLTARAHLSARGESVSRVERELRFVEDVE